MSESADFKNSLIIIKEIPIFNYRISAIAEFIKTMTENKTIDKEKAGYLKDLIPMAIDDYQNFTAICADLLKCEEDLELMNKGFDLILSKFKEK